MPPKTRRAGQGPTAAQSKLSFNNRITKSTDSHLAGKPKTKLNEPAQETIVSEIAKQTTPEPDSPPTKSNGKGTSSAKPAAATVSDSPVRIIPSPSRQKSKRRARRSLNDDDEEISFEVAETQANKISDAQVRKYWKAEEDSRLAPRGTSLPLPFPRVLHLATPTLDVLTNVHFSPPNLAPHLRENPPTLRPLLRVRTLHRHHKTTTMETCTGVVAEPTDRGARCAPQGRCKGCGC